MDIHITNKTNKSWEVVYIIENVRQLLSKHRVNEIFSSIWVEGGTDRKIFVCCAVK